MNKNLAVLLSVACLAPFAGAEDEKTPAVSARMLSGSLVQGDLKGASPEAWTIGDSKVPTSDILTVSFPVPRETVAPPACWLHTSNGDKLGGQIKGAAKKDGKDVLMFESSSGGEIAIDFERLKAAVFPQAWGSLPSRTRAEVQEKLFGKGDLKSDLYYFDIGEGRIDYQEGFLPPDALATREVERELPDRENEGQMTKRKVPLLGVRFFAAPDPKALPPIPCLLVSSDGSLINGAPQGLQDGRLALATALQKEPVRIPLSRIRDVEFRTDRVVYLSDLEPAKVEARPFLKDEGGASARPWPFWVKDQPVTVAISEQLPLRLKGKNYRKGLGVHSYCKLAYALEKKYERFMAEVGIDDHVMLEPESSQAGVVFRVLGDGRELWKSDLMTAAAAPQTIAVDVSDVKTLELVVDFGDRPDEFLKTIADFASKQDLRQTDILDRADWAGALLVRKK